MEEEAEYQIIGWYTDLGPQCLTDAASNPIPGEAIMEYERGRTCFRCHMKLDRVVKDLIIELSLAWQRSRPKKIDYHALYPSMMK